MTDNNTHIYQTSKSVELQRQGLKIRRKQQIGGISNSQS